MAEFCPSCGYNFTADAPLERGDWLLEEGRTFLNGKRLSLTRGQSALLYAVAKGDGKVVRYDAILNRISDSDNRNLLFSVISQVKRKIGRKLPIRVEHGTGLSWDAAA